MGEPTSQTRRQRLEAARDALASAIETCESNRDLPSLVREYRATLSDLATLPDASEVSVADEIAQRRAKRRANASRKTRAASSQ